MPVRSALRRAAALAPPLVLAAAALLTAPAGRLPGTTAAAAPADTIPVAPAALRFSLDRLLLPVDGIAPGDLRDSFTQGRSGGRRHNAIDIMAPRGTPVLAVSDGTIAHKGTNRLGGRVLYLLSPDRRYAFYYAHLDRYAAGVEDDAVVRQGDTLGFVGSTGNARAPHLHFQVLELPAGNRHPHAGGRPVNPYPLLRGSRLTADEPPTVRG
jgi:murein DD-endopeptidase MepM/ murein hydrolase activator NlpD